MKKIKFYKTYRQAFNQALKLGLSDINIIKDIRGLYCIGSRVLNKYYRGIKNNIAIFE